MNIVDRHDGLKIDPSSPIDWDHKWVPLSFRINSKYMDNKKNILRINVQSLIDKKILNPTILIRKSNNHWKMDYNVHYTKANILQEGKGKKIFIGQHNNYGNHPNGLVRVIQDNGAIDFGIMSTDYKYDGFMIHYDPKGLI